ncbi:DUF349 domain-containing protein [Amphritea sp. 1_MG-2023]|uniref:DUF349 domain-containing protein n=1 Tax=Amphritea sp. 1_MG-2023 TaxID=3062670 RepID=UPI0026E32A0C|nr:DUF349 domain-containing protein [Amphritea sp. 1_MG-2023]MDO6562914.1 DUF349 domain-containing protein [Amphritea sp. 1_MG-2023]
MFAKFFKPRWQHNKATVRVRAVHRLSTGNTEHREVLARLARQDQSIEVRLAAVEKIASPDLLSDILTHDMDPDIRRSVAKRICEIILDPSYTPRQQQACVHCLQDENMLAHIAINGKNPEIQQQAICRINDQHSLISVIMNANSTQIRQLAAEKLDAPELLEQASKSIRGRDKTVYRIIRNKQQQLQEQARLKEQRLLRKQELLCSLEQLSKTAHFPLYSAKLDALCLQWQTLTEAFDEALDQRYRDLVDRCQKTLCAAQLKSQQQHAEQQKAHSEAQQQSVWLQKLEETVKRCAALISGERFGKADLDAEQSCWDNTVEQLHQTCTHNADTLLNPFKQPFEHYQQAGRAWLQHQATIVTLLESAPSNEANETTLSSNLDQIEHIRQQINWPSSIAQPNLLQRLLQQREQTLQQINQLKRLRQHDHNDFIQLLNQLEQQIDAGQIKHACQLAQTAESQLENMSGAPKSLQQRYKGLQAQLHELKNWQGFAVSSKKEALCEAMEALIDSHTDAPRLAKQIHALQQQWKSLDSDDPVHSHKVWQRFKAASDQAYAPCEHYFRQQKQQRTENLEKRKQLVNDLNQFLQQLDWQQPDWSLIEQVSRTAKREWKTYAPVDRTPGRQVQTDFNALLKQIDQQIAAHRDQVANEKKALLAQAQQLLTEDDLPTAATEIRALQKRWKLAGNTFHSLERELWPEFRKACNQVFENLNKNKQSDSNTTAETVSSPLDDPHAYEALLRRIELCDQLESFILDGTLDQLALDDIQAQWHQSDSVNGTFGPLIDSRYAQLLDYISGNIEIEDLLTITEKALRQLCIRLEILLGLESPEQDQTLRMEYQMDRLQKALQQRQPSSNQHDLKRLELEWQCQPLTLQHEALQIRFYSNLQQAN